MHGLFLLFLAEYPAALLRGLNASPERSHVLTWRSGGNNLATRVRFQGGMLGSPRIPRSSAAGVGYYLSMMRFISDSTRKGLSSLP